MGELEGEVVVELDPSDGSSLEESDSCGVLTNEELEASLLHDEGSGGGGKSEEEEEEGDSGGVASSSGVDMVLAFICFSCANHSLVSHVNICRTIPTSDQPCHVSLDERTNKMVEVGGMTKPFVRPGVIQIGKLRIGGGKQGGCVIGGRERDAEKQG